MKMEKPEDLMMNLAMSMHDSNRSGSNYGKLFLLNELISILETIRLTKKHVFESQIRYKILPVGCDNMGTIINTSKGRARGLPFHSSLLTD